MPCVNGLRGDKQPYSNSCIGRSEGLMGGIFAILDDITMLMDDVAVVTKISAKIQYLF